MYGLELRAVVWRSGVPDEADREARHGRDNEFDHARVQVARGTRAVVVADADVATALADTLTGLSRPVSGHIFVDGVDVTGNPPAPDRIALVPVGGGLLPHLSVAKNIEFNLNRSQSAGARAAQVRKLAAQLQLDGALDLKPHRLSPEQRLRVAAARALARQPSTVVVEDRSGEVSCAPVVRAAVEQNVAVLVITDSAGRAGVLSSRVYAARPVSVPGRRQGAGAPAAPGGVAAAAGGD